MNTPIRNCLNCAHSFEAFGGFAPSRQCIRTGKYCTTQCKFPDEECDSNFSGWQPLPPKPPRRSLRQWFIDTFTA